MTRPRSSRPPDTGCRVEVALPLPIDRTFTYRCQGVAPVVGTRVLVPFGRSERVGWVVGDGEATDARGLRDVLAVLDERPSVPDDLMALCTWMADYYLTPLGLALRTAMPNVLTDVSRDYVALRDPNGPSPGPLSKRQLRLVEQLRARQGPQRVSTLRRALAMGSLWPEIRNLRAEGLLTHEIVPPRSPSALTRRVVRIVRWLSDLRERDETFARAPRQREAYEALERSGGSLELSRLVGAMGFSRSVVSGLERRHVVALHDEEVVRDPFASIPRSKPAGHELSPDQKRAVTVLEDSLARERPRPILLHGVTGSGKTLVYIELLRRVLERGRTGIVLVPEIALTPQTVARFRAHFDEQVAVIHSGLSQGERYDAWRQLASAQRTIAVGARSALFAPLPELGAIVVDEEHDGSYKQSEAPRYNARDLAVVRARQTGAVCVLGSATPALESWLNAERGKFARVSLPERVGGGRLPPVQVVDLREVRRSLRAATPASGTASPAALAVTGGLVLTPPLVESVRDRLARAEQIILLLNRRGYSSFVQCRSCGDVRVCVRCSISLTYHRTDARLVCHHCRHFEPAPSACHRCRSGDLAHQGLGTEQVERVVAETFPGARIARMDVDTTSGKGAHHRILARVERGEIDILLGTQMIAKGLDFPRVTLVGVVNADVGLHLPDFRASERTFQLLAQVAGRAGRGSLGGAVVVQTSLPRHHAIQAALSHDYEGFATKELEQRKDPLYPPHVRLANVVLSSPEVEAAAGAAESAVRWIRRWQARERSVVEVVGPSPSPIERLHGRWRWHFMLRASSAARLGRLGRAFVAGFKPRGGDVRVIFDRDPSALL